MTQITCLVAYSIAMSSKYAFRSIDPKFVDQTGGYMQIEKGVEVIFDHKLFLIKHFAFIAKILSTFLSKITGLERINLSPFCLCMDVI